MPSRRLRQPPDAPEIRLPIGRPSISTPETSSEDRYEEWAEGRREELRQLYLALLFELAGLYEERGDIAWPSRRSGRRLPRSPPSRRRTHP